LADHTSGTPPVDKSPLDNPLSPTYVGVLILEAAIIVLLFVLGRLIS
jgi:hypothetical protein